MGKFVLCTLLSGLSLAAQTVQSVPFRALLSPRNEVPSITDLNASAAATVWVHVVRDGSGQVISGSVDFNVRYTFPGAVTINGMHIHRGAAGVNGPVTIGAIGGAAGPDVNDPGGQGELVRQAQVPPSPGDALDTIRGLLQDPSGYYLNVHTSTLPAGAMRGQLARADRVVLMAPLSPLNEVPPIAGLNASGAVLVTVIAARTSNGTITSAEVRFDASYSFPGDVTLTGFHIHPGAAGENGPVSISSGLRTQPSGAGGIGSLSFVTDVAPTDQAGIRTLDGLFNAPSLFYANIHTSVNAGGAIRGQLRATDSATFQVAMLPDNEVPAVTGLDAHAHAQILVETIRDAGGAVTAGAVTFDVNYRFPDAVEFTGMHIHDQVAGQNGPVTIGTNLSATNSVSSASGFGNVSRIVLVTGGQALTSLNSLVQNPEKHYANLHSRVNPGGVVRSQLVPANTAAPSVYDILSAVSEPTLRTVAPGGLMTLFGFNLTKVAGSAAGLAGGDAPSTLNGTEVRVAGTSAPILLMAPGFVVAQLPVDAKPGMQAVVVKNANGSTASRNVQVADAAPAVYFDAVSGIVFHVSDMSLIRPENPALAGEPIAILATGLGVTVPSLETGKAAPLAPLYATAPVAVTIGGQPAFSVGAGALPGYTGWYLVVAQVPANAPSGSQTLSLKMGEAVSNTVRIPIQ